MFSTARGDHGVVAAHCQSRTGDEIWELSGCPTPIVLRRVSDGHFQVITPCYFQSSSSVRTGVLDGRDLTAHIRKETISLV